MTRLVKAVSGLGFSAESSEKINEFIALLSKWNASINLSAARSTHDIEEHVVDSLHVIRHLESAARVVDVGSGGGFPVVVAAIALPNASFVSLEPVHKKHAFLRTAARELDLVNLEAFAERVEDHRTHDYDAATSRATFDLVEWLSIGRGLVRENGLVIGFEGVERTDVPAPFERYRYELEGKSRSIIIAKRGA